MYPILAYFILFYSIRFLGPPQVSGAFAPAGGVFVHPFGNRLLVPIGRGLQPPPGSLGRVHGTHSHYLQGRERVGGEVDVFKRMAVAEPRMRERESERKGREYARLQASGR
jgi:hypothetical protein